MQCGESSIAGERSLIHPNNQLYTINNDNAARSRSPREQQDQEPPSKSTFSDFGLLEILQYDEYLFTPKIVHFIKGGLVIKESPEDGPTAPRQSAIGVGPELGIKMFFCWRIERTGPPDGGPARSDPPLSVVHIPHTPGLSRGRQAPSLVFRQRHEFKFLVPIMIYTSSFENSPAFCAATRIV